MERASGYRSHRVGLGLVFAVAFAASPAAVAASGTPAGTAATAKAPSGATVRAPENILPATSPDYAQSLTPFGTWVEVGSLGRVWQPDPAVVGPDFMPYVSGGYWTQTPLGPQFVSAWAWGATTFHYGRWFQDALYGWVWQPGDVWGNAWVNWRATTDDIGWAPTPPAAVACYVPGRWAYVPRAKLTSRDLSHDILTGEAARQAAAKATVAVRLDEDSSRCARPIGTPAVVQIVGGTGAVGGFAGAYTIDTWGAGSATAAATRFVDRTELASPWAEIPAAGEFHHPISDVRWDPHVTTPRPELRPLPPVPHPSRY